MARYTNDKGHTFHDKSMEKVPQAQKKQGNEFGWWKGVLEPWKPPEGKRPLQIVL